MLKMLVLLPVCCFFYPAPVTHMCAGKRPCKHVEEGYHTPSPLSRHCSIKSA